MLGQLMKNCSPREELTMEKFVEDCLIWEEPHAGAGAECEEPSTWGKRSGRDNMWWTDHNTHSPSPCAAPKEEGDKREWSWAREEGRGRGKVF